jgi:uncharacterized protein with PQ loop repeat
MHSPLQHLNIRRRVRLLRDPYPHYKLSVRTLDNIVLVAGVMGPLMTLPQIHNIWVMKNASGVSPLTWGSFAFFNVFWLLYGLVHKEKPIIVAYSLWLFVNSIVTIGALLYG